MRLHNDYADDWPGCCLLYANNMYYFTKVAIVIANLKRASIGVLEHTWGLLCVYREVLDSFRIGIISNILGSVISNVLSSVISIIISNFILGIKSPIIKVK